MVFLAACLVACLRTDVNQPPWSVLAVRAALFGNRETFFCSKATALCQRACRKANQVPVRVPIEFFEAPVQASAEVPMYPAIVCPRDSETPLAQEFLGRCFNTVD